MKKVIKFEITPNEIYVNERVEFSFVNEDEFLHLYIGNLNKEGEYWIKHFNSSDVVELISYLKDFLDRKKS